MKIRQIDLVFYKLYIEFKKDPLRLIPAWEFVGEILIEPYQQWYLMSYKCPAQLSTLYLGNSFLEREYITGKSGAKYYGYRVKRGVNETDIKDHKTLEFYRSIKYK